MLPLSFLLCGHAINLDLDSTLNDPRFSPPNFRTSFVSSQLVSHRLYLMEQAQCDHSDCSLRSAILVQGSRSHVQNINYFHFRK